MIDENITSFHPKNPLRSKAELIASVTSSNIRALAKPHDEWHSEGGIEEIVFVVVDAMVVELGAVIRDKDHKLVRGDDYVVGVGQLG